MCGGFIDPENKQSSTFYTYKAKQDFSRNSLRQYNGKV